MKKTMTILSIMILSLFVLQTFSFSVNQQEEDPFKLIPLVKLISPDKINLNGTWNFTTSKPKVGRGCPAGSALSGTAVITQKGKAVTLQYTKGAKCKPAGVCFYTGTLDDKNGCVLSNSVKVDNEGGTVSGAIRLRIHSNKLAAGKATAHYVHPQGFECKWNMKIKLTKGKKKKKKE